jgi:hypothetical protein
MPEGELVDLGAVGVRELLDRLFVAPLQPDEQVDVSGFLHDRMSSMGMRTPRHAGIFQT